VEEKREGVVCGNENIEDSKGSEACRDMKYDRIYNFSAGPANMYTEVLEEIAAEMMNYRGSGMCVMEMSHRSSTFLTIAEEAEADLRTLMGIPDQYKVLFIQGGATLQFAMIPMNLLHHGVADYMVTGSWSKKAYQEAQKFGRINLIASSAEKNYTYVPDCSNMNVSTDADYVYICENETINGTTYCRLPETDGKVLVSDQSSMFLSKPCDVNKYGLIMAGVQKNVGPAGLAIVIIREDLIRSDIAESTPKSMRYDVYAQSKSMHNTPNCWAIYVCGKVFRHIIKSGGLEAVQKLNEEKAALLYQFLDQSKLFSSTVEREFRSCMNIPFVTPTREQDADVVAFARAAGFENLKGHRSVGGLRASIYNAMPKEGVEALVKCLHEYEETHT